ncbi:ion channel [Bauldia sp.]|uniref:ion channel n=1 Tax=Bauldia sp. TaxID=2575872 RepID=UPI003BADAA98
MIFQIIFGGALLSLSALSHVLTLVLTVILIQALGRRLPDPRLMRHSAILIAVAVGTIVAGHTVVVWVWALTLQLAGALPTLEEAVYFTLVTYTTLGYGDLILGPDFRVFGAMAAVTGLLNFGLSTAFLVALLAQLFSDPTTLGGKVGLSTLRRR